MGEKLGYQPALDGVRAVSIALVLVFHLGASWMAGGYLGVSLFFTLSGFLITSLLLGEREQSGRIDVRAFYVRRLRRLLPASLLCLVGIALLSGVGLVAERSDLRAGVLGAAFQVANWVALLGSRSYADLFLAPSPIDHFWSLAIEEQFYWLWPLAIAGLTSLAARRADRHRTVAVALTGTFVALSVSAFVTAQVLGGDAAYFASWARFAEIIAGAALAAVVANRSLPTRVAHLAMPCLIAIVVLAVLTPAGSGWAYSGGLPLFALLTVGLIAGVQVEGPVRSMLSSGPLPAIGRVSYGLYLFHWPVFTILDAERVHQSGLTLAVVRLAATGALTVVSYHLIERPIRSREVLADARHYLLGAGAAFVAVIGAIALFVPTVQLEHRSNEPVVIKAALTNAASASTAPVSTTATPAPKAHRADAPSVVALTTTTTTAAPVAVRVVALFGDSIADWLVHDAAPTFARADVTLVDAAVEGCDGADHLPPARIRAVIQRTPDDCKPWPETYPVAAENPNLPIDIAVLVLGNAPMIEHEIAGRWVGPCDTMDWYTTDLRARVVYLRQHVGDVVLALPAWGSEKARFYNGDDHLALMGCVRTALQSLTAELHLDTVDLAAELCPAGPAGPCPGLREQDGLHVDHDDAPAVLDWLLDRLVALAP